MRGIIACALDVPRLAEAADARGLSFTAVARTHLPLALAGAGVAAAVVGWKAGEGDPAGRVDELRRGWTGPLLMVLAEGHCGAVVRALDAGADDAIALPSSAGEIAARAAARLRPRPAERIEIGALAIDRVERRVTRDGQTIALLPREYALLLHLARQPGLCVSRAELLRAVWGLGFDPGTNVVEVHISRLRAKLDRGFAVPMLRTEKRRGYWLDG